MESPVLPSRDMDSHLSETTINYVNWTEEAKTRIKMPDQLLRIFATLRAACQVKMDHDPAGNFGEYSLTHAIDILEIFVLVISGVLLPSLLCQIAMLLEIKR